MRTVFVCLLLCSFVVGIASKVPRLPECPTLPRLQRCRAGIADQCTKDLDCPPFTRCCSDGCTRRCVDTLSKLITYRMRTKYGACARPPLNKCTAKADLCYDDSYCLGDEKCCIDTDCGKKCLLPEVLQLVKNSTKAFKCLHVKSDGKKCPRDPNHQCSVDSECPTYTTCCFDGCRKRCTDRHGKIVSNIQGYLCPILPQPATCTNPFQECQVDKDCTMSMKCCSDACNYWCMPSYPPPAKTIFTYTEPVPTERNLRKLHKPGNCPVLQKPKSCNDEVIQCNYDVDCWNSDKKCCDNGCVNVCVDPASTSSFVHLLTDKITKQPTTKPPTTTKTTTLPPRTQESSSSKQPLTKKKTLPSTRKSIPTTFTSRPETTTTRVSTGRSTTERKTTKAMTKSTYAPAIPTRDTKVVILNREGVVVYPESTEATAGQNIVVTCSIKGEPFEGWYTPKGLKITSEQDNSIFVRGRGHDYTLVINQVEQMHGGKYTCRGAFSSATYELYIKLHIDTPANKQFLRAGSTGIVEVAAKGYPRPQATWMKDLLPIRLTSGRYAVSPSGSLIIKGVQLSDKGHYSIIANHFYRKSNPGLYSAMVGSSDSADITVDVIKDKCPMPQRRRKCRLGQKSDCLIDRDCTGSSVCCTDGCLQRCVQQGNQENNYCPYLIPPSNCSSIIKECTSDNQCSGNKKCCSDSCRFKCVNSQASNSEIIPGVQVYPGSKSFCNPTQTIRLVCRVDKQPFEGWFDSYNRKVTTSTHGSRMMVEDHSEYQVLVIKNVTARDGGMYTCQGALDSATIHVSVNQTIDKYEHPIMLYPGQAGLLLQNIQCYPPPRFIWYKRGKPLDLSSDRYSVSPSGSLGIRRIRSTDMGVYTLKLQMSDEIKDTGVKVAAAVDGVDFTEWQDSLVPGASVRCHKEAMYIDIEKKVLKEYNDADLSLRNSSCRASSNETHYTLRASLVGCGTVAQFTKEAVVYSNIVQQYRSRDMISRLEDIKIPFSCFYTKEGVTSTFGLLPSKVRRVFDGGNVTTKFELGMSLYRDSSYSLSFGVADFPLRVTVNRPLFVQVKIDSPDRRLTVMADRCYATPTQDPRHPMQYDIIKDGCPVDPTVVFYKGPHTIQRFSFKAFKFLAKGKIFVYLHCHLIVCNVTDPTSRCAIGCLSSSFGRFRRDASPSAEAELTQGPFLLEKKPAALPLESGSSFKQYIWIMVGMVGFCILCLIAMVYMKKQISRQRKRQEQQQHPLPDPDRETYI